MTGEFENAEEYGLPWLTLTWHAISMACHDGGSVTPRLNSTLESVVEVPT